MHRLPGRVARRCEYVTLASIPLIFVVNYALGAARAAATDLIAQPGPKIAFAILTGRAAGTAPLSCRAAGAVRPPSARSNDRPGNRPDREGAR